jgi:dTDP-glucose 4,6-dehydratase
MKRVLVTGAGGFIGSHLCEHLVRSGKQVRAFIHYNSKNDWGWLETSPLKKEIEVFTGDLRDYDSVYLATENVSSVYHLGALIGIPYSYQSPLAYIKTNVEGTYNILESARRRQLERVLVTSTSEVYGTALYTPIDEKHPFQPQSPYSATKIAADNLALSYHLSFNLPVVIARPFNTFGPRQSARAIIPTIITQLLTKSPTIKLGSLEPSRDLTFVADTASGMQTIAETNSFIGKTVNIGTGQGIKVGELFDKLCQMIGHRPQLIQDEARIRPQNSEVMVLLSNNEFLRRTTNWKPQFSIDEGLRETIHFLEKNLHLYKPEIYTV